MVTQTRRTLDVAERECALTYDIMGSPYESGLARCIGVNAATTFSRPSIQLLVPDSSISGRKILSIARYQRFRLDVGACALRVLRSLRAAGIWGAEIRPEHMLFDTDSLNWSRQEDESCVLVDGLKEATTELSDSALKAMASSSSDPYGFIGGHSDERGTGLAKGTLNARRLLEFATGAAMFESLTGYKTPLEITHTSNELTSARGGTLHSAGSRTRSGELSNLCHELDAIASSIDGNAAVAEATVGELLSPTDTVIWAGNKGNKHRGALAMYSLMLLAGKDDWPFTDSEIGKMMPFQMDDHDLSDALHWNHKDATDRATADAGAVAGGGGGGSGGDTIQEDASSHQYWTLIAQQPVQQTAPQNEGPTSKTPPPVAHWRTRPQEPIYSYASSHDYRRPIAEQPVQQTAPQTSTEAQNLYSHVQFGTRPGYSEDLYSHVQVGTPPGGYSEYSHVQIGTAPSQSAADQYSRIQVAPPHSEPTSVQDRSSEYEEVGAWTGPIAQPDQESFAESTDQVYEDVDKWTGPIAQPDQESSAESTDQVYEDVDTWTGPIAPQDQQEVGTRPIAQQTDQQTTVSPHESDQERPRPSEERVPLVVPQISTQNKPSVPRKPTPAPRNRPVRLRTRVESDNESRIGVTRPSARPIVQQGVSKSTGLVSHVSHTRKTHPTAPPKPLKQKQAKSLTPSSHEDMDSHRRYVNVELGPRGPPVNVKLGPRGPPVNVKLGLRGPPLQPRPMKPKT